MAYRLVLPKFGMAMQSAKVIEWKKETGDYVSKEEAVLVVENEKLVNEIVSMEAGVLLKKVARIGEDYLVGDTLAWLGAKDEIIEDDADKSTPLPHADVSAVAGGGDVKNTRLLEAPGLSGVERNARIAASPLAKKLAAGLGLDYTQIPGSGPGGRIEKEDVLNFAESMKRKAAPPPVPYAASEPPATTATQDANYTIIPYTGMRKSIGDRIQGAWSTIPMVTNHVRVDAGAMLELRKHLNDGIEDKNLRLSVNDLLMKLTATALTKMPVINATYETDGIHVHKHVNLGMATALENGLIVPVIKRAEEKSLTALSMEAKTLAAAARSGRLTTDDVTGGTFTVSNLGMFGSVDFFSPVIDPPQVAILGVGRTEDTVVAIGDEIRIRPIMSLSLTYDHRAIDGATAARFMKEMLALFDKPQQALLS